MTLLAAVRRSASLGVVALLLAACGGAVAPAIPATSAPRIVSAPREATSLSSSSSARTVPDAGRSPSQSPSPSPSPSPIVSQLPKAAPVPGSLSDPSARPGPFTIDLFRRGDFVSEARADWCVPAAIQMMGNIVDRNASASMPSQRVLDRQSRALSSSRLVGLGSEPQGWAGVLNALGDGPYVVVARRTFRGAISTAVRALRLTGRPVGLLVWRGAHAWVMSGFETTADPARSVNFRVTRVRILDPWYPRATSSWGPTRAPDTTIGLTALARNFLRWHRPAVRYRELDGRFVLVLPMVGG